MLEIQRKFNQLSHKITIVVLAGLIWLVSLPVASVQADGYYSEKTHKVEVTKPFYATKERKIAQTEPFKPYYATRDRQKVKANVQETTDDYIESGKRATEVIPKDMGSGSSK
jgi:hypothetical protein